MAEQGVAPVFLYVRNQEPGSSRITASAVARRGCLKWLDVDGLKGGANAVWIEAR